MTDAEPQVGANQLKAGDLAREDRSNLALVSTAELTKARELLASSTLTWSSTGVGMDSPL
jgi:hypothetical protein